MKKTKDMIHIGQNLVKHSAADKSFSAHRGAVDELFPFIYEASRRMSLRAIARWLKSEHGISLSPNTLARAMRNEKKYWLQMLKDVAPSVRLLARELKVSEMEILTSAENIEFIEGKISPMSVQMQAIEAVKDFWARMPSNALCACLACAGEVFNDNEPDGFGEGER